MNEEAFFQRLIKECQKINKSINQIERELGYPRNALHNYKIGRIPSGIRLVELSEYFGVSPKYLLGEEQNGEDDRLKKFFNGLNTNDKKHLSEICNKWLISSVNLNGNQIKK